MKRNLLFISLFSLIASGVQAQNAAVSNYIKLNASSPGKYFLELRSDIDSNWARWQDRGYHFGFNKNQTPIYTSVNGILSTPYMIQVRGNDDERNKKRWGFHVFEGYARDDRSRITMLVNKHTEESKAVAELYYYGTVYDHSDDAYNWLRIGSDVRGHSFMFSRDQAVFYGSLRLTNALTLGRIGKEDILQEKPVKDAEQNYKDDARYVNYNELTKGGDGTIFYDKDHDIVVIKIKGKWKKVAVEALPDGVEYSF